MNYGVRTKNAMFVFSLFNEGMLAVPMLNKIKKFLAMLKVALERNYKVIILFSIGWGCLLCSLFLDLSTATNNSNWFARSGAMLCVSAVLAEFRLANMDRKFLYENNLKDAIAYSESLKTGIYPKTSYDKRVKYLADLSLIFGTIVWAYGDLII